MRVVRAVSGTEMPIYAYKCPSCEAFFEAKRPMESAGKTFPCPFCKANASPQLAPASIPPSRVQR